MKNFNTIFNQLTAMPKRLAMVLTVLFTLGVGSMWGQEVLFHETFGDNSNSARNWLDTYSVKSGISEVYADVTYTMTNLKQSKNSVGCTQSGLVQTTKNSDASIVIGPLNVTNYEDLELLFMYKVGSVNGTYKRSAQYKTSSNGSWIDLVVTGTQHQSTCNEQTVTLPSAVAGISTLYIKIVFNTSNTGATIDEVEITGTKKASCSKPAVAWQTAPADGEIGNTMTASVTTNYSAGLTYSSSNTNVATINNSGNITYKAEGTTTITAQVTGDGTTYCNETVTLSKQISVTCGYNVKITKGTETNGTFTLGTTGTNGTCGGDLVVKLSNIKPATNYQFGEITQSGINTGVTIDQANKTVTYAQNTSGTSTINVTFDELPKFTVTWSVDGSTTTEQVYENGKASNAPTISTLPCGDKFVGWTTEAIPTPQDGAPDYFTTVANSPAITDDITFYAVFADYAD